jgi:hypothetical protein
MFYNIDTKKNISPIAPPNSAPRIYIGHVILAKMLATATEYVLALATLGDVTKNRNNPIFCCAAQEQW